MQLLLGRNLPAAVRCCLVTAAALALGCSRGNEILQPLPEARAAASVGRVAAPVSKPAERATSLQSPSYVDRDFGNPVYRATSARDFAGAQFVRHDYSRRQAFNANNTRYLARSSDGYWLVYDAQTFEPLRRSGHGGSLKGLAGDAEAIWHPKDPNKLWYTNNAGGLRWLEKNVETDLDVLMADFTGRLPWPGATGVWTKAEGTSSADGRFWAFMATSYDAKRQANIIHGLLTYDRTQDRIVGVLDAARFGGVFPDHISISPSGKYAVPSWAFNKALGTRAYTLDFSSFKQLHAQSEHSDLAIGADGSDMYVVADYDKGQVRAIDIASGSAFDILSLYPQRGASYAVHISGQAFERPGWVIISTYADSANYGKTVPNPAPNAVHRSVMLVELRAGGRKYGLARTMTGANYGGYAGEPQATISRDGRRVMFASNFDDGGPPSSYIVALPEWGTR